MIAFYPIKQEYTDKILTGEKTFELRKRLPKPETKFVVIYTTFPKCEVVGFASVLGFHKKSVSGLWKLVSGRAGIQKEPYLAYFDGSEYACAIEFDTVYRFVRPFPVSKLKEGFKVPQSFCYLDRSIFNKIKRRKVEEV